MSDADPLTHRRATSEDVQALVALVESAYRGESSRQGWTTEADLLGGQRTDVEDVRGLFDGPGGEPRADSVVLVVEAADRAIRGCCHLERRGDRAYFGMFAVEPHHQGDGAGRALLADAERLARDEWGSTHLEMTVIRQRVDLIAYYLRRGFTDTQQRSPFPYGNDRFGEPRRDDLEFTLLEKAL